MAGQTTTRPFRSTKRCAVCGTPWGTPGNICTSDQCRELPSLSNGQRTGQDYKDEQRKRWEIRKAQIQQQDERNGIKRIEEKKAPNLPEFRDERATVEWFLRFINSPDTEWATWQTQLSRVLFSTRSWGPLAGKGRLKRRNWFYKGNISIVGPTEAQSVAVKLVPDEQLNKEKIRRERDRQLPSRREVLAIKKTLRRYVGAFAERDWKPKKRRNEDETAIAERRPYNPPILPGKLVSAIPLSEKTQSILGKRTSASIFVPSPHISFGRLFLFYAESLLASVQARIHRCLAHDCRKIFYGAPHARYCPHPAGPIKNSRCQERASHRRNRSGQNPSGARDSMTPALKQRDREKQRQAKRKA